MTCGSAFNWAGEYTSVNVPASHAYLMLSGAGEP